MRMAMILAVLAATAAVQGQMDPYVHDTVVEPVPDMIRLDVPKQLGNQDFAALGFVDITAAPFRADPGGNRDSTDAIQRAVDFARDHQMVCFLPPGRGLFSDVRVIGVV